MTWTTRQRSDIGGQPAIVMGDGPDVLLLHGVGLRAEAWGAQLEELQSRARLIAPDMPGHGQNTHIVGSLPGYVSAAEDFLLQLGGSVVVVGHSMGAMIALELAAKHPGKVRAVAALNAVFERGEAAADAVRARADQLDGRAVSDPSPTLERWFGQAATQERAACRDWLTRVDPRAYKEAYTAFAHSQTPDRTLLTGLACPALFMTGSEEPNSTPDMSRSMADLAPKGRAIIAEGAAHMMPMTHAAQVNAQLLKLLNETKT